MKLTPGLVGGTHAKDLPWFDGSVGVVAQDGSVTIPWDILQAHVASIDQQIEALRIMKGNLELLLSTHQGGEIPQVQE